MNFSDEFIQWIQIFIIGLRFSITVNGGLEGYFKGAKGIRQGDPLSPYIFVLVMNVLSLFIDVVDINGIIEFWQLLIAYVSKPSIFLFNKYKLLFRMHSN